MALGIKKPVISILYVPRIFKIQADTIKPFETASLMLRPRFLFPVF
ncbi:hypothetical protein SAMN03080598_03608 [Algoriphagus boritolerans DSM 17298 = JCM 18970]|uniref:Uncharacterized protein n=1 Tax=Algoriphagus boritolerans DSM 17298 = JCM 18970 TaxID=1120964 RepID=A0A1H5ZPA0_9BACT|nr:hypothetical protein SAMN03080598_03608 [Algoriphagus boritolerans DSM 17298 = JCM 18970]